MSATVLDRPAAPQGSAAAGRAPLGGFLSGVLLTQIVNSALHLAQPLLMISLSGGSLATAAFFSSFDTAVHMAGAFVGGWPADLLGARRLLILSTLLRGACLALIPILWLSGHLTLVAAMAAYTLDAFVRGFSDTAVHALPLELGEGDRAELDRLNSRYEFVFDLGGVLGPLVLGALLLDKKSTAPHALIPVGFALAALAFLYVPKRSLRRPRRVRKTGGGSLAGLRLVLTNRALLLAAMGLALLNLYPLRKLLSAFFAKAIISQPHAAGWVGAAFGLGGALGALAYAWRGGRGSGARWVAAGGAGVLLLAVGWIPASLWPMMAAAFAFSLANVGARLALTRRLQERTPHGAIGGVTAVSRFAANGVSVGMKALIGAAFAFGAGPRAAFALVAVCLALVAAAQFGLAAHLRSTAEPLGPA
ncbi:MAG: MFS transporter [Elusimicrobiota bacterium]